MGIETEQYIRKPLYVDAVRITEENFDEIAAWVPGEVQHEGQKKFIRVRVANPKVPRQTKAYVGDWILWTERGGHKVYTPKAFKAAFDKVEPPVLPAANPVIESPEMAQARQTIEAEGGTVEPATPQAIVDVVNEQQPPQVEVDEGVRVEDTPTGPPTPTDGKRVLTLAEQQQMRREEITDLIRSGEVVLEQDLAA